MKIFAEILKAFFISVALTAALICTVSIAVSCEEEDPPPPIEYFTDITYEVIGTGGLNPLTVNYGDLKYGYPNYPDSLIWNVITEEDVEVPWSKTVNTCVGHPVKMGVITSGKDKTMTFNIYDDEVLVATKTFESNGFLWGGTLEYNIPNHE